MKFLSLILEPAVLIIVLVFVGFLFYMFRSYFRANHEIKAVLNYLNSIKKTDLVFKFSEIDSILSMNKYFSAVWHEFKNTLIFSENVSLNDKKNRNVVFENISNTVSGIQTTIDPIYFFNEENIINSKFNNKLINAATTILTGLGPLFTFLNIAFAFANVDFATEQNTIASVANLMSSMQVAALCSVFAVSFSLIYLFLEKFYYNKLVKKPFEDLQDVIYNLFDNVSSEKFLIELLKETKVQNNSVTNLMSEIPDKFKEALNSSVSTSLIPYFENLIFCVNKLREKVEKIEKLETEKKNPIDELF